MSERPAAVPPSRQVDQPRLRTVPTTLRDANAFVAAHHRHRDRVCFCAVADGRMHLRGRDCDAHDGAS
ncbi:MAG: hypothetical protein JWP11_2836 [Frankiales bacterium]|nr:hypothetical protein [Frankiales bacterium]